LGPASFLSTPRDMISICANCFTSVPEWLAKQPDVGFAFI